MVSDKLYLVAYMTYHAAVGLEHARAFVAFVPRFTMGKLMLRIVST